MPSGDNRRRPFACPECGGKTQIGNSCDAKHQGRRGRSTYRNCPRCKTKIRTFLAYGDPPEAEHEIPMTGRGLYPRQPKPVQDHQPPRPAEQAGSDKTIRRLTRLILALLRKSKSSKKADTRRFAKKEAAELYQRLKAIVAAESEPEDELLADITLADIGITGGFDRDDSELRLEHADRGGRGKTDVMTLQRR